MGQYWILVNLTKGEYVKPVGGLKLCEIAGTPTMMWILTGLLADHSNGSGGGDLKEHPMIGRWAGDSVLFVGDYGRPGEYIERVAKVLGREFTEEEIDVTLYEYIQAYGADITEKAHDMIRRSM